MLRPFLLIGVGGSGGKTLRVIRDTLRSRLLEVGWPANRDLPRGWQFLQIDVATVADGDDPDLPPQLPPANFLGLVGSGVNYTTLDTSLAADLNTEQLLASVGGWKPDPSKVTVSITKGAGQYRSLGRIVALTRLEEIRNRAARLVDAVTDAEVRGELDEVGALLGQPATGTGVSPTPMLLVVSSIAGGSGAGAFIDICDVLRSFGRGWMDESVGILYAPDVFDGIAEHSRRGVRPNALATLSEMMAGYWSFEGRAGGMGDATAQLYRSRRIETASINRLGPRYSLLVGARNSDVAYGEQNDIYRGMGVAIAEWMTSRQLQDQMQSYVFGNWASTASSVPDKLGLKAQQQETPFSAFGFARLSLGRDTFAVYSSQYLARLASQRVLRQHLKHLLPDDTRTDNELIESIADSRFPSFLDGSGLDERGTEHNQVLTALRPTEQKQICNDWVAQTMQRITSGVSGDGLAGADWLGRIEIELRQNGPAVLDRIDTLRRVAAREWVKGIQVDLAEHVADYVAREGAPVTLRLMNRLAQELDVITRELPDEFAQASSRADKARTEISAKLMAGGSKIPATGDALRQAVHSAGISLFMRAEADLIKLTEDLLRDAKSGLVAPLTRAVDHGLQQLQEDARPHGAEPATIDLWPSESTIPARLRPSKNEFLLDDVDRFPDTCRALLRRDTGKDTEQAAEDAAARAVIVDEDGADPGASRRPRPMLRRQDWVPSVPILHETSASPSAARYEFALDAAALLARAGQWVRNDQREFGRFLAQGLGEHLEDSSIAPKERAERLARFKGQLRATLERGKPLVEIDNGLLALVHDSQDPKPRPIIAPMPLPAGSESALAAREVVDSVTSEAPGDLLGTAVGQSISVFWVLGQPYEPVVFTSLMGPIAAEWADARMDSDSRQMFWTQRRARPMPEFVPAAPAIRRSMVRGWFTGLALGQVRVPEAIESAPVEIWVPAPGGNGGEWRAFPHPFLKPYGTQADAIGAVLGSMVLSLLAVHSQRTLEPLAPYHRLRDLGASGPAEGVSDYETLNGSLQRWIAVGAADAGAPVPASEKMGGPSDSSAVRREMLERRFDNLRSSYVNRYRVVEQKGDVLAVPRDYELRDDIIGALDDLLARVRESDTSGGDFV